MNELAAELAALPGVVETLLARHLPDKHGRCMGCTNAGTGIPERPWPCALHFYAAMAALITDRPLSTNNHVREIIMAGKNPDQPPPPPKGPCSGGGQHNWVTSGHIRTCTKRGASEVVH